MYLTVSNPATTHLQRAGSFRQDDQSVSAELSATPGSLIEIVPVMFTSADAESLDRDERSSSGD